MRYLAFLKTIFPPNQYANLSWWFSKYPVPITSTNQTLEIMRSQQVFMEIAKEQQMVYDQIVTLLNDEHDDYKRAMLWDLFGPSNDWIRYADNKKLLTHDHLMNMLVLNDVVTDYTNG